jgi:hypothetical protein
MWCSFGFGIGGLGVWLGPSVNKWLKRGCLCEAVVRVPARRPPFAKDLGGGGQIHGPELALNLRSLTVNILRSGRGEDSYAAIEE